MILYAVHYRGPLSSYDWSIVTIHTNEDDAYKHAEFYKKQSSENGADDYEYAVIKINTEVSDPIYDYSEW